MKRLSKEITAFYILWAERELSHSDSAYMSWQPQFIGEDPSMEDVANFEAKIVRYFKRKKDYRASRGSEGYDILVWKK